MKTLALIPPAALGSLLVLAPWAITFRPPEPVYRDGVWAKTYTQHPTYEIRTALIVGGLVVGSAAAAASAVTISYRGNLSQSVTGISIAGASLSVGWCLYPYWVNGLYSAYSGAVPVTDFDPKALPPMIWLGEMWRAPCILLLPGGVATQFAAVIASVLFLRRRWYRTRWFWVTMAVATVHLALVLRFSPRYMQWLLD